MNGEDAARCVACVSDVKYILIECGDFAEVRYNITMLGIHNNYSKKTVLQIYLTFVQDRSVLKDIGIVLARDHM